MQLQTCYYCSSTIYPGHGMTFVRNDGRMFPFCRSKCRTHFNAKHHPKKSKWTKAHRKSRLKELAVDSVFNFEKTRNRPVKYNRDLYIKTIQAMKTIQKIKARRQKRFYEMRMKAGEERHLKQVEKEIRLNHHILDTVSTGLTVKRTLSTRAQEAIRKQVEQEDVLMI